MVFPFLCNCFFQFSAVAQQSQEGAGRHCLPRELSWLSAVERVTGPAHLQSLSRLPPGPSRALVLQPCTQDSSFSSSSNSCGTSWPHNLWATNVFPRRQLGIFSFSLMLDSTICTFGPASQPLLVFSFSASLCLLCTELPALKSFPKKAQQLWLHDKVSLGFRLILFLNSLITRNPVIHNQSFLYPWIHAE